MNKIVEFDSKICKTDDDRTGAFDPPIRFIKSLKSSAKFMKDNIPSDTIYFICAFLIFKRKCCDAELLGEASRLYGSKLSRNFEDFSDFLCRVHSTIESLDDLEYNERELALIKRAQLVSKGVGGSQLFKRAKRFVEVDLQRWSLTPSMRCMQRFFRLKQNETLKLMREETFPDYDATADLPETSDSEVETDLKAPAALQVGKNRAASEHQNEVGASEDVLLAHAGELIAAAAAASDFTAFGSLEVADPDKTQEVDLEAARIETLNSATSSPHSEESNADNPLEDNPLDDVIVDIFHDRSHGNEGFQTQPQVLHPQPAAVASDQTSQLDQSTPAAESPVSSMPFPDPNEPSKNGTRHLNETAADGVALEDMHRMMILQQLRDDKIREGLLSFGIDKDGLDGTTAVGLTSIFLQSIHDRESRESSNSKAFRSSQSRPQSAASASARVYSRPASARPQSLSSFPAAARSIPTPAHVTRPHSALAAARMPQSAQTNVLVPPPLVNSITGAALGFADLTSEEASSQASPRAVVGANTLRVRSKQLVSGRPSSLHARHDVSSVPNVDLENEAAASMALPAFSLERCLPGATEGGIHTTVAVEAAQGASNAISMNASAVMNAFADDPSSAVRAHSRIQEKLFNEEPATRTEPAVLLAASLLDEPVNDGQAEAFSSLDPPSNTSHRNARARSQPSKATAESHRKLPQLQPRAQPVLAWQEREGHESDLQAMFGLDDVSAVGLRSILQSKQAAAPAGAPLSKSSSHSRKKFQRE